ncbi:MAG: hypothetical protein R2715_16070 [Ilumatobacteraceae bacterium]
MANTSIELRSGQQLVPANTPALPVGAILALEPWRFSVFVLSAIVVVFVAIPLAIALVRHIYVVPPHEFHVVRILGVVTVVRRPGPHLGLGGLELRQVVSAGSFVVEREIEAVAADGGAVRVHASFELRVVDPVRYLDHRSVAEATAPRVASGVVAELLTVCSRAELADQRELLGHTVTHRIDAAVRRFGLAACSTFLGPPVGAMVA